MQFPVLHLNDINFKNVEKTFEKTLKQLQEGDFKSADVRKMANTGYYRARLDIRDRLLFTMVTYENQKYLLLLEVIKNHNYQNSRFLQGTDIPDEDKFVAVYSPNEMDVTNNEMIFLNEKSKKIHLLNKFISFDKAQNDIYSLYPPLIIVGSAGSGKTALVLEKLKELHGDIAYISLSNFLVENASNTYYSNGYENEKQDVEFMSLHQYLSSWEKPNGTEVSFPQFEGWFNRYIQTVKINEPYRVFEEFKGVITGSPIHTDYLSENEYIDLGVKQSIFSVDERKRLYPLYLKYLNWLKESNHYDSNILCYSHLEKIKPRYDFIVVDEVQDITNIQLKAILQSLKHPNNFILTGDSNQIVHPNFFSWSKVKTFFYKTADNTTSPIKILQTNYRNSLNVVEIGNKLLKIKNTRFGSIDRESNYLIGTVSKNPGEVLLYADDEKKKNELNQRTQNSTQYAVIVPTNEQKAEARRYFKTPLVFSVQEAKGLEYDNVILLNFISSHEGEFREIIKGVTPTDLLKEELTYNRSGDKTDKDAEIYKFYINSFYVAITRAIKNIYIFEKQSKHPAMQLLQMQENREDIKIKEVKSTADEWLAEARRLEEQGKHEQAEQIRAKYLGYEYVSPEQLAIILNLALDPTKKENEVKKERKQLFQYAVVHQRYDWVEQLAKLQFQRAVLLHREVKHNSKEYVKNIRLAKKPEVIRFVKKYGVDFIEPETNSTGLMISIQYAQKEIISEFFKLNANIKFKDKSGKIALDQLLAQFYCNGSKAESLELLKQYWKVLAPTKIDFEISNRQLQANSHSMLYFLMIFIRAMQELHPRKTYYKKGTPNERVLACFKMAEFENYLKQIPDEILPAYRKNRSYINSVLSSNEVERQDFSNCKMSFTRVERGVYVLHPEIIWL
ncbi:MAG: AAA family ATPase [Paludibacter sp.]|nr:AAA family ATPase [Paludibacter sp.]